MPEEHPKIYHNQKAYYQIGCKYCQQGNNWKIYADSNKKLFIAQCKCGHKIELNKEAIQNQPEPVVIDARFIH